MKHLSAVMSLSIVFMPTIAVAQSASPHPDALPNPHQPGEVDRAELVPFIVQDGDDLPGIVVDETEAVLVGNWQYSTHTPPYVGLGYLHDQKRDKGECSVTYTPELPREGRYEVRLSHCYNIRRATNTPVTIHHADGETTLRINQQQPPPYGRLFRSLGIFRFQCGEKGWVRISTEGTTGKYVIADAVQFLPIADSKSKAPIVNVMREVYIRHKVSGKAPWVYAFPGKGHYREEIHTVWSHENQVKGYGDSPAEPRRRLSYDNGRTWTELRPLAPLMTHRDQVSILDWKFCGTFDPKSGRHVALSIHHVRDMRQGPPRMIYNHALVRTSADGGRTFEEPEVLKYEQGEDLDPNHVLNPDYLAFNTAYPGQSILRLSNGNLLIPVTNTRIPSNVDDKVSSRARWPAKGTIGSLCFTGRWNEKRNQYQWTAGKPVWLPRNLAFNGLLEADVAELNDGRILMVFRVTKNQDQPAYKWFSVSDDGGMNFLPPEILRYSDQSHFYSGSNFHRLFRSRKTKKLYWLGNIVRQKPTNAGHPRYPLVIAEVDEATLALKKPTVTPIDSRQPGEGQQMQLSNFWILENSETLDLEIYLTRLQEIPDELFSANAYKYTLTFGD